MNVQDDSNEGFAIFVPLMGPRENIFLVSKFRFIANTADKY